MWGSRVCRQTLVGAGCVGGGSRGGRKRHFGVVFVKVVGLVLDGGVFVNVFASAEIAVLNFRSLGSRKCSLPTKRAINLRLAGVHEVSDVLGCHLRVSRVACDRECQGGL